MQRSSYGLCALACSCVQVLGRWIRGRSRALLQSQQRSILVTVSLYSSSVACLSPRQKCPVKRADMNSFYTEMKLLMPTICYRQWAARQAAATQRRMQHQLESCRRQQWDTWCHLSIDEQPFSELSIAYPLCAEHLFLHFCKTQIPRDMTES